MAGRCCRGGAPGEKIVNDFTLCTDTTESEFPGKVAASLVPTDFIRLCPRGIFEARIHGQPRENRTLEG